MQESSEPAVLVSFLEASQSNTVCFGRRRRVCCWLPSMVRALGVGERPQGLERSLTAWGLQRWGLSLRSPDIPGAPSDCWEVLDWCSLRQTGDTLRA